MGFEEAAIALSFVDEIGLDDSTCDALISTRPTDSSTAIESEAEHYMRAVDLCQNSDSHDSELELSIHIKSDSPAVTRHGSQLKNPAAFARLNLGQGRLGRPRLRWRGDAQLGGGNS